MNRGYLLEYQVTLQSLFEELDEESGVFDTSMRRIDISAKYRGITIKFKELIARMKEDAEGSVICISLKNFRGGHSGVEINKGRYNANVVMGRLLMNVQKKADVRLVTINGGEKDNAIANFCEAKILVGKEQEQQVCDCLKETFAIISKECRVTDPDVS